MARTKRYTFSLPRDVVEPLRLHFMRAAEGSRPRYGSMSRFVADALREKMARDFGNDWDKDLR